MNISVAEDYISEEIDSVCDFTRMKIAQRSSSTCRRSVSSSELDMANTDEIDDFIKDPEVPTRESSRLSLNLSRRITRHEEITGIDEEKMEDDIANGDGQNHSPSNIGTNNEPTPSLVDQMMQTFPKFKKRENIRQTIIRRFKKNARKIIKYTNRSQEERTKGEKDIKKAYALKKEHQPRFKNILNLMTSIISDHSIEERKFQPSFNAKSCNDTYINKFFSKSGFRNLFLLHLELAEVGDMYTKKCCQFKGLVLSQSDMKLITDYSASIIP